MVGLRSTCEVFERCIQEGESSDNRVMQRLGKSQHLFVRMAGVSLST